ncbi:glycosyl transferases group 1-domain-containing protein [Sphaerosporella brunnea]|uniref:Chitobiosyldiphosphodolichol beta-mannosyltransferase n=1 Tax=Sphaerosporella brunnea TaxID=1250544 RepID=A0A5J5F810_9PEZI|nr:glycosyl transferases group 1-domain-containing protein [Sphaerosporella brunnea]
MDVILALQPWATVLLAISLSFTIFLVLCLPTRHNPTAREKPRVVVLVLGDIGRSPRMQYHALSIARKGGIVDLVGYNESQPRPELLDSPSITIRPLKTPPKMLDTSTPIKFIIYAPFKAIFQLASLLQMLLYDIPDTAGYLLLQNPPAIPTLAVAKLVTVLRGQKLVVDWHNFGYSILGMKLGDHPIVWGSKLYELIFGRGADVNFTVTHSMNKHLRESWHLKMPIHTLYDRPPSHFQPFDATQRSDFLTSNPETAPYAAKLLSGQMKLVLSSTSWTADEDFSIFLQALVEYDRRAGSENFLRPNSVPDLLVVITGRGPLRDGYIARIETLEFQYINVKSIWLEPEDYPKMIACADLGVSLHTSSSGMDLPMKVVDLFGVGVPVVAVRFACVQELVKDGENGATFTKAEELATLLSRLFDSRRKRELEKLKEGAMKETKSRWDENWDKIAAPVFGL